MTIKVFTVAEMVAAEKAADAAGHSYAEMMELAGRRVAEAILERWEVAGRQVLVLVGPGNNGGDGLVAGRYLAEAGAVVAFYLSKPRDRTEDGNLAQVMDQGLEVLLAEHDQRYRVLRHRLRITNLVVDALLGTGLTRPIEGELAELMRQVNGGIDEQRAAYADSRRSGLLSVATLPPAPDGDTADRLPPPAPVVVAVDCPSGLNSDTGELDPLAQPAHLTVTFAGPKRGHFRFPGAAACGELVVADIGIRDSLPEVAGVKTELATAAGTAALLPERPADGHKGTFGTALIVAGSAQYWGAPALSARAAMRSGAGLVALAVPAQVRPIVAGQLPEATFPAVPDQTTFSPAGALHLLNQMRSYDAVLVGPGLGEAGEFLDSFLTGLTAVDYVPPLVVDADGLNLLSLRDKWPSLLPPNTVLTPHPGEMARLVGRPLDKLREQDRVELARRAAEKWGHVVVLKGAYTVIGAPQGEVTILPFANPVLATAGSGDVLAGVIVSLLAQGLSPYAAAVAGGYWHGAAGRLASEQGARGGVLAGELADWLPWAYQRMMA
jgi:NAD(P)H-hydrate epimerase